MFTYILLSSILLCHLCATIVVQRMTLKFSTITMIFECYTGYLNVQWLFFLQAKNLESLSENLKTENEDLNAKMSSLVDKLKEVRV